ncbi:MAG: heme exporter protein CcmB [Candidatus Neomarinimicrobiota bacterium]
MFWRLLKKDLLIELRSKEISATMLAFGLAVILIFAFAFNLSSALFQTIAPGLYWVMVLFVAVLGLHRVFTHEKEFDTFSAILSAPIDRGLIFLSKCVSGIIFLLIAELLITLPFILFLQVTIEHNRLLLVGLILLGNVGIMTIGSLVSGLAMRAKMSEVLLPILLFPLVAPQIIAAVKTTAAVIDNLPFSEWRTWLQLMITFAGVFGLAGYLLFEHLTEE